MGPRLTVRIIEVSLFHSVNNIKFHSIPFHSLIGDGNWKYKRQEGAHAVSYTTNTLYKYNSISLSLFQETSLSLSLVGM